jgi:hypothetical protein
LQSFKLKRLREGKVANFAGSPVPIKIGNTMYLLQQELGTENNHKIYRAIRILGTKVPNSESLIFKVLMHSQDSKSIQQEVRALNRLGRLVEYDEKEGVLIQIEPEGISVANVLPFVLQNPDDFLNLRNQYFQLIYWHYTNKNLIHLDVSPMNVLVNSKSGVLTMTQLGSMIDAPANPEEAKLLLKTALENAISKFNVEVSVIEMSMDHAESRLISEEEMSEFQEELELTMVMDSLKDLDDSH